MADQVEEVLRDEALEIETQGDPLKCIRQSVIIAEKSVKCLLDQPAVNQFFAVTVLKVAEAGVLIQDQLILKKKGCLRLFVMSAETAVKCLSNQVAENQSTAAIVLEIKKKAETEVEKDFNPKQTSLPRA